LHWFEIRSVTSMFRHSHSKLWLLLFAALPLLAQHEATPGDIDDGRRLFVANCALCHGPEGDSVPGVELGRGKFRAAANDEGVKDIIRKGIPGTAMPPHTFTDFQIGTIVAYLHFLAASSSDSAASGGNPSNGKAIFQGKGGCTGCHRVNGAGSRLGPELTDIGTVRRAAELKTSILEPDAEVLPQNRFYQVTLKDGTKVTGRLLNQDAFTIQLLDSREHLVSYSKSDLQAWAFAPASPMPSFKNKLSPAEITDLVSYLVSLKGIVNQ
jgi:putative heme-binding domain-containing protein